MSSMLCHVMRMATSSMIIIYDASAECVMLDWGKTDRLVGFSHGVQAVRFRSGQNSNERHSIVHLSNIWWHRVEMWLALTPSNDNAFLSWVSLSNISFVDMTAWYNFSFFICLIKPRLMNCHNSYSSDLIVNELLKNLIQYRFKCFIF